MAETPVNWQFGHENRQILAETPVNQQFCQKNRQTGKPGGLGEAK